MAVRTDRWQSLTEGEIQSYWYMVRGHKILNNTLGNKFANSLSGKAGSSPEVIVQALLLCPFREPPPTPKAHVMAANTSFRIAEIITTPHNTKDEHNVDPKVRIKLFKLQWSRTSPKANFPFAVLQLSFHKGYHHQLLLIKHFPDQKHFFVFLYRRIKCSSYHHQHP